jgi:N-acetylglucosaminyldiphosphoundecaprenol N-acetyl-beta-D-mannosaminyltransferase
MASTAEARSAGIGFFAGGLIEAADAVVARARDRVGGYACLANVHVVVTARREPTVQAALAGAWTVFPDGAPVAWFEQLVGRRPTAERVPGPDLMPAVIDRGRAHALRHVLFGSTRAVLDRLELRLLHEFPEALIVRAVSPAPGEESSLESLAVIRAADADLVWVALGAPKQEVWMRRHAQELAPALLVGVGAAFDFGAGTKRRAPHCLQRLGLEWLHRLASEPRRLAPRYLRTNTAFAATAARELLAHRRDGR